MIIETNILVIVIGLVILFKIVSNQLSDPNFKDNEDFEIYENQYWNKKN